jgi:hypothetical protein
MSMLDPKHLTMARSRSRKGTLWWIIQRYCHPPKGSSLPGIDHNLANYIGCWPVQKFDESSRKKRIHFNQMMVRSKDRGEAGGKMN